MTVEKAPAFSIGDHLHGYELVGVLGQGGHAIVFHGHDAKAGRDVAIKVIQTAKRDLRLRGRAEGQLLVTFKHPHVVEVFDTGVLEDGRVYIVMEKLEGKTLREIKVRLHRLSIAEALHVGVQVASGVLAAHARKVIHRDLKPDNIFVLSGNTAKVLDFGIAKYLEQSFDTTQKRMWQGTPDYMAPEQFQGLPVSFRSDVFALGTTLYELIAGIKPGHIGGVPTSIEQFAVRQFAVDPPLLHELDQSIPQSTSRMIRRALAKSPADRFDMQDFLRRMQAELEKLGGAERGAGPRDLLKACEDTTDPDFMPAFTALSQRTTGRRSPVHTNQVTVAGALNPRVFEDASPLQSQPRVITERLFEPSAPPTRTITVDDAACLAGREGSEADEGETGGSSLQARSPRGKRVAAIALGVVLAIPFGVWGSNALSRGRAASPQNAAPGEARSAPRAMVAARAFEGAPEPEGPGEERTTSEPAAPAVSASSGLVGSARAERPERAGSAIVEKATLPAPSGSASAPAATRSAGDVLKQVQSGLPEGPATSAPRKASRSGAAASAKVKDAQAAEAPPRKLWFPPQ